MGYSKVLYIIKDRFIVLLRESLPKKIYKRLFSALQVSVSLYLFFVIIKS